MSQHSQKSKLRLRKIINTQPRKNNDFSHYKKHDLTKYQYIKNKTNKQNTQNILLEVKAFKTDGKIFNQIVKFLEETFVEIYKINFTSHSINISNKPFFKRKLPKKSIVCLYNPHKNVFEVPIKIGEILLYGSPSKDGYIIKVKNKTKYEYIIEEHNIL